MSDHKEGEEQIDDPMNFQNSDAKISTNDTDPYKCFQMNVPNLHPFENNDDDSSNINILQGGNQGGFLPFNLNANNSNSDAQDAAIQLL